MIRTYSNFDSVMEGYISEVIDCGFVVHRDVGPGYMESLYSNAMCVEMRARGIPFEREKVVTVNYRDHPVGIHRLDVVIRNCIVVEFKAVSARVSGILCVRHNMRSVHAPQSQADKE